MTQRLGRLCFFLTCLGCGHAQPLPPQQPAPAAAPEPEPERAAAATTPEPKPDEQTEQIKDFMHDHFQIARFARDAVIEGNLEALRAPLRSLADYRYDEVAAGGWMNGIAQLQAAARLTSEAETLTRAASGVATMARVCGECHRDQGHPMNLAPQAIATVTPKADSVTQRMQRHDWATERLWEGLVAPSDRAWQAGAAALAHAPARAPKPRRATPPEFAQVMSALRELGVRASAAHSLNERTDVYALMLATCAQCHAYNEVFEF
jgi:hypothetical protein